MPPFTLGLERPTLTSRLTRGFSALPHRNDKARPRFWKEADAILDLVLNAAYFPVLFSRFVLMLAEG
jgi:hypothetical protein